MELEGQQARSRRPRPAGLEMLFGESKQGGVCTIWKDPVRLLQAWGMIVTRVDLRRLSL